MDSANLPSFAWDDKSAEILIDARRYAQDKSVGQILQAANLYAMIQLFCLMRGRPNDTQEVVLLTLWAHILEAGRKLHAERKKPKGDRPGGKG